MITVFDVETSGLPDRDAAPEGGAGPCVVQIAACLCEDDLTPVATLSEMWRLPDGHDVSPGAARVHGITRDRLERHGLGVPSRHHRLLEFLSCSEVVAGYNVSFDLDVYIRDGFARGWGAGKIRVLKVRGKGVLDPIEYMTEECDLPPTPSMLRAGRDHAKTPRLEEAYEHCTGRKMEGAHDALVDVHATIDVIRWMVDRVGLDDSIRFDVEADERHGARMVRRRFED